MMGGHHAASGAAAWVAIASTGPYALGWYPLDPTGIVIGAATRALPWCATGTTAPAPSRTPCRRCPKCNCGWASRTPAAGTGRARIRCWGQPSSCFLQPWPARSSCRRALGLLSVGAGVLCMFMINIAAKALKLFPKSGWISNWVFALIMAGLVTWFAPHQWTWLPVSMPNGVLVHIVGDIVTTGGVPLLWPLVIRPPKFLRRLPVLKNFWRPTGRCPSLSGTGWIPAGMARAHPGQRLRHGGHGPAALTVARPTSRPPWPSPADSPTACGPARTVR